jgi:hypothetical protein
VVGSASYINRERCRKRERDGLTDKFLALALPTLMILMDWVVCVILGKAKAVI